MKSSGKIKYRGGYKYQLRSDFWCETPIKGAAAIGGQYVALSQEGILTVKDGYAWDGPSGPTFDTADFMRGSLAHDALYQLMRMGHLGQEFRDEVDQVLYDLCREDGMTWWRAKYVKWALRRFAAKFAARQNELIQEAP